MRTQSRYVMFAVCIALVATGSVARGSGQKDEAAEISGFTGKNLMEFKANMNELRVSDKQLPYSKDDVSAEEAKRMTTKELIMQTSRLNINA